MFRIHFEPKGAYFCIQILTYGFIWVTVKRSIEGPGTPVEQVCQFETYDAALKETVRSGLDKLYQDRSVNRYREHMQNGQSRVAYAN